MTVVRHALVLLLALGSLYVLAADSRLIVVRDQGGASALPYYQALSLRTAATPKTDNAPALSIPSRPEQRYSEADLLPLRSARLTPGPVERRVIRAPGMTPLILVGDDAKSRQWLQERIEALRALHAVGFVVRVESLSALESIRALAPGITLVPASGDDLAGRLGLLHYPVLITATGIEQ